MVITHYINDLTLCEASCHIRSVPLNFALFVLLRLTLRWARHTPLRRRSLKRSTDGVSIRAGVPELNYPRWSLIGLVSDIFVSRSEFRRLSSISSCLDCCFFGLGSKGYLIGGSVRVAAQFCDEKRHSFRWPLYSCYCKHLFVIGSWKLWNIHHGIAAVIVTK